MDSSINQASKKGTFQSILIFLIVCAVIVVGVATVMYYLNQDNELMPDATPASPLENKSAQ